MIARREQLNYELDRAINDLLLSATNAHHHAVAQLELPFTQKAVDLQAQAKSISLELQYQSVNVSAIYISVPLYFVYDLGFLFRP